MVGSDLRGVRGDKASSVIQSNVILTIRDWGIASLPAELALPKTTGSSQKDLKKSTVWTRRCPGGGGLPVGRDTRL